MPRRGPDRALKRAVADLARLHPDDVQAVLGALAPAEKARLDALLAPDAAPPEAEPVWRYESVSPWLLARIDPDDRAAGRASREFVLMTEAGRAALREAAEPFRTQASTGDPGPGRALLSQAWRALFGARS